MKKSHKAYLQRVVIKAIAESKREDLTDELLRVKTPDTGIYRMIRDIVCDSRFYSVTDKDPFWKTYGTYRIGTFLDSLPTEEWEEETFTMRKEDFLNDWMASNMLPLSQERRTEIEEEIRLMTIDYDGIGIPDPDEHDGTSLGVINLGNGIKDTTERTGLPTDRLPGVIKDYMDDASGGNTPGLLNYGHRADARFLDMIDPSIRRLAEKIGRIGSDQASASGTFRRAPKSDISGVAVGDDLSSLLPTELALLATPESEKVFLDRFARKRLQIFSSSSKPTSESIKKSGPIYVCIDTSGSMTGVPEEMAKTLALAISIIAQKGNRPVCIFNYSDILSFFVLKDLKRQRTKLLRFLSESYGGGNDENKLFEFLFRRMPKMAKYREVTTDMKGADLLVVSDFQWIGLEPAQTELLHRARKKGMRIFSVGIGFDDWMPTFRDIDDDPEDGWMSGFRFFRKSDFRFRFEGGVIKER